jgi:hypothetical protein
MGISLPLGGEGALLTALLHSVVRSHQAVKTAGFPLPWFPQERRAGSIARTGALPEAPVLIVSNVPVRCKVEKGAQGDSMRTTQAYSPKCVEQEFSEVHFHDPV